MKISMSSVRVKRTIIVSILLVLFLAVYATRGYWLEAGANSLVFNGTTSKGDVILIENVDHMYLLFERAARLSKAGMGSRIIVPVETGNDSGQPQFVSLKVAELMCETARISDPEIIAVVEKEPYSIGVARQVAARLQKDGVRSVLVVTAGFRSRRTYLIYQSVMSPLGIRVSISPVFGGHRPDNWSKSWHGILQVFEQFLKLQYYRWIVL